MLFSLAGNSASDDLCKKVDFPFRESEPPGSSESTHMECCRVPGAVVGGNWSLFWPLFFQKLSLDWESMPLTRRENRIQKRKRMFLKYAGTQPPRQQTSNVGNKTGETSRACSWQFRDVKWNLRSTYSIFKETEIFWDIGTKSFNTNIWWTQRLRWKQDTTAVSQTQLGFNTKNTDFYRYRMWKTPETNWNGRKKHV